MRWYTDDAISGDDTEKRLDFQRMIDDAQEQGDFEAILCWDQDRFGRFDSTEAGYWIYPLRKAGVHLATVAQGKIDWTTFAGRTIYGIQQEGKHAFLRDLSRNVLRGQMEAAKNGSWIGSRPLGYRLDGPRKNRQLVIGDPTEVQIVERIFFEYVEEDRNLSEIADRLTADGILTRKGGKWRFDAVKTILENPAYIGTFRSNPSNRAKYHHYRNREIVEGPRSGRNDESDWDESDWIVMPDHHEPIIGKETFTLAQQKLAKNTTGRPRYSPDDNPYLFTGKLQCGLCGAAMWGEDRKRNSYECSHAKYEGNCKGNRVRESDVLEHLGTYLEEFLGLDVDAFGTAAYYGALASDDLPEAFAKVKEMVTPRSRPKRDRKRLEKRASQLQAKIAKGKKNLVFLDEGNIPEAQSEIRQLEELKAKLDIELRLTSRQPPTISTTSP